MPAKVAPNIAERLSGGIGGFRDQRVHPVGSVHVTEKIRLGLRRVLENLLQAC